ncbi:MAG: hypothetical protein AAGA27_08305 [Pseudomonadota bacterium]
MKKYLIFLLLVNTAFAANSHLVLMNHFGKPLVFTASNDTPCLKQSFPILLKNNQSVFIRPQPGNGEGCSVLLQGATIDTLVQPKKPQEFVNFRADFNQLNNGAYYTEISGYIGQDIAYSWNYDKTDTTFIVFCKPSVYQQYNRCPL